MPPALKGRELHEGMNSMRQVPAKGLLQAACVRQIQCFIFFFFFLRFQSQQLCITYILMYLVFVPISNH